jgi:hypothetical protein
MPYSPQTGDWYADRVPSDHYDTFKTAAEQLALDVEEYLFNTKSPNHMNPSFLSWAVARFDATKTSSGNIRVLDYVKDLAAMRPIPAPVDRVNPHNQRDDAIRFPADAVAAAHIDTDGSL